MPEIPEEWLEGIGWVESRHNPHAIGDRHLKNKALGAFQMRLPAYQDVQRFYPQQFPMPFEQAMAEPHQQRAAAKAYLQALQDHYGLRGDAIIGAYNAGPRRGAANTGYINKVKSRIGNPTMKRFK